MSSIIPWGTWTSGPSLPSDVLAKSHLQPPPPPALLHYVAFASYCLCIASARPAPLFFCYRLFLLFPPPSSSCVSLVALGRGHGSDAVVQPGQDGARDRSAAAAAFGVKVVLRLRKKYAMSPANRSGGEYISGRKSPAGGSRDTSPPPPPPISCTVSPPPIPLPSRLSRLFGLVSLCIDLSCYFSFFFPGGRGWGGWGDWKSC